MGPRAKAIVALLVSVPVPSLGVLAATSWLGGSSGALAWSLAKLWFFALPLWWLLLVERERPSLSRLSRSSLTLGLAWGVLLCGAVGLVWWWGGERWLETERLRELARHNGIAVPLVYLGLALYLALVNSLLEEYAWRWFVVRQLERAGAGRLAIVLGALCFTAHHTLLLEAQLGTRAALVGSLGVFGAGCVWSWLYRRTGSVWAGWVSHVAVDVVLLWIGWSLIRGA